MHSSSLKKCPSLPWLEFLQFIATVVTTDAVSTHVEEACFGHHLIGETTAAWIDPVRGEGLDSVLNLRVRRILGIEHLTF